MSDTIKRISSLAIDRRPSDGIDVRTTPREWLTHGSLFLLTFITTTLAGLILMTPALSVPTPPLRGLISYLLYIPRVYFWNIAALIEIAFLNQSVLAQGLTFSLTLLAILTAHEMGHYLACRRYGVKATLPFFIPAPPLFLAGTFGAFIKIRSVIPSRKALFDIGLAGPLAGFIVALPVAVIGILNAGPPQPPLGGELIFNDPLLFRLLAKLLGVQLDPYSPINPCYLSAWIGLLVTSLNLMPVGQLDGGHGTFAFFGGRAHSLIGRAAFLSMVVLALLGFFWHGSPSGFLYCVLLGVMLKVRHPQPVVMEPLGKFRVVVGLITLTVFVLCFWPFPITLT
ncbi:MAG TPA: site-2 protease family protein [Pyrinomonadaceae bacterium]|nr:site-2 protease family protein [Pyrinomonadaceae bacterium]